ncbi:MAG: hypothetical protein A3H72_00295 [Candidatus Doudnabacteria bacterium RIFCSPLOWO2_02_FULL_48_8]|uniref:CDP-alcohol phosphatidyltransferase n=1 Tax=Candidatus Doudnabacteria bacterium RIFCSPHIGHO2_01_FULL_46_24 TaxID=1817825 RepID=A0A1F5NVQ8_9BACT|nr:MAG: hypothetical protein A2720_00020 [Candidatus Doudnabacteria bacterium RIFCSPHIGHO2_01_FULL_46_24]OGE95305.1 MAG: hypothetical protein A3H72_00295 [Candidatus Doudnabacteria bacterium RIFCSPLOWO2_02_FULL_48_8]OGE95609.1 MAG: hypothetical protein A3E98_01260 [Candidatus Doudnabacteria bacterium RIFCSPHIGHO2_12_FULL_48_11]
MTDLKWLPNSLSYSRAVLGALVIPPLAYFGQWEWAFWIMVAAALTDFADGAAANLLKCGTRWGKEILDPRCDGTFAFGIILGWALESDHFSRFLLGIAMLVVGEWLYRIKHGRQSSLQRFAAITLPLCLLGTLYVFGYYYAHNAYGDAMQRPWFMASLLIVPATLTKLDRFKTWATGQL